LEEAKKLESMMKYPMEDLDLPIYRRNPPLPDSTVFLDMAPGSGNELEKVPNPSGDLPIRPPSSHNTMLPDCFGTFLMTWSFLNVFSRPLHLSPFSLDDFEWALRHTSMHHQKNVLVYEVMVALLNCIIRHHLKPGYQPPSLPIRRNTISSSSNGYSRSSPLPLAISSDETDNHSSPLYNNNNSGGSDDEINDNTTTENSKQHQQNGHVAGMNGYQEKVQRVCASDEVINIGKNWDARPIPIGDNRHGWEDVMIGCINDVSIYIYI
jgi:hypothetical protein